MPAEATATLARISTPSIPNSWYSSSLCPSSSRPSWKTGSSQWWMVLSPSGRPRAMPSSTDGMASRMSGTVMTRGDSWILSTMAAGPRNSPQKVRPISRNM